MIYSTLSWQPVVAIGLLCLLDRLEKVWRFVLAWSVATLVSITIMPLVPALGGYLYHGLNLAEFPGVAVTVAWEHAAIIDAARDGSLRVIGTTPIVGLVTFPSFHACGAVLLAWAFRSTAVALPALVLNAFLLVSAIPIGGHYLIDVVAGVGTALAAIAIAERIIVRSASTRS